MSKRMVILYSALGRQDRDACASKIGMMLRAALDANDDTGVFEHGKNLTDGDSGITGGNIWYSISPEDAEGVVDGENIVNTSLRPGEVGTTGIMFVVFAKDLPDGIDTAVIFNDKEYLELFDNEFVYNKLRAKKNPLFSETGTLAQRLASGFVGLVLSHEDSECYSLGVLEDGVVLFYSSPMFVEQVYRYRSEWRKNNHDLTVVE